MDKPRQLLAWVRSHPLRVIIILIAAEFIAIIFLICVLIWLV